MPRIVLTEEQMRILTEAGSPVDVVDSQGRPVALMRVLTPEEIALVERWKRTRGERRGPSIPSEQVQALLRKFEEIDQREGMTREKMEDLLRRVRAGEPI
jgi:hypothetical protein